MNIQIVDIVSEFKLFSPAFPSSNDQNGITEEVRVRGMSIVFREER